LPSPPERNTPNPKAALQQNTASERHTAICLHDCSVPRKQTKINRNLEVCYMKSNLSLGQFRIEAEAYKDIIVTFDDPLSPLKFSLQFDHIAVNISASPYIALKSSSARMCLNHICSIKRHRRSDDEQSYIFLCNDYTLSDRPTQVRYTLRCS